ncbi:MAG: AAA family ATPase [Actinobacteria bacterium]|nr:AAA family ATPase [Actinomycetota bacterium]
MTESTITQAASVVVATPVEAFEARVRQVLTPEGGEPVNGEVRRWGDGLDDPDPASTVDAIAALGPDVVAIGPGLAFDDWVRLAEAFDRQHPEIDLVLFAEPTPRLYEVALRTGVRQVVPPEADDDDVRAALEEALATAGRRRANLLGVPVSGPKGHVVAIVGPKGGVGKTTIATNLAVGLAAIAPREVVLIDLDLQFGDVAHALRIDPDRTIADALRFDAYRDITSLKAFLTPHPSGAYVLCAPDSPAAVDEIEAERVGQVVRMIGEAFPYVVVDTASGLDEFMLAGAEAATDLVMVGVTDVPSVRSMRKEAEALDRIGMTTQARHFVLNRADREVGLSLSDIEETVGMPVDVAVPSSVIVTVSVNQGIPIVAQAEASPPKDALLRLVGRFAEVPVVMPKGRFARRKEERKGKDR